MIAYRVLDVCFFVLHTAFIVFIAAGWAWQRVRRAHLASVGAVAFSWLGLGLVFGLGFCPCTDWHWRVRERLGDRALPDSYIKFLADRLTGCDWNAAWVDGVTVCALAIAAGLSIVLNWRDKRRRVR